MADRELGPSEYERRQDAFIEAERMRSIVDLQGMTEAELIAQHDALDFHHRMSPDDYRDELNRRALKRSTDAANRLAWLVLVLTVIQVGLVIYEIVSRSP